ncbi:peptidoglycan DD-metalloendopeptidase family protein [Chryseobacterium bernardetii]|uniref:peptidoglycan DD-metalloendopeptidase family protein n=1 Tax=Chryseobacterium bernardetii TaxID=1241978 RepID=UPI000F4F37E4|nr:peptidoglycan DD-metalloendopeptidase family protein [Chryseobacterium bernardetii]AZB35350.1 hypothetical protein EG351_18205 [Chryseobacterium bernardetii]
MSKQGIYKISGNTKPKIGELVTYKIDEWYPATPLEKRNPALVTWHLFKKVNGRFVPTNVKKMGVSSFTFNTNAYKDTFRIEAYLHNPEGRAPMALEVQPQPSDIPRINKVELKYIDDTPGTVFSFMEKLIAEAQCTNLEAQYLQFSLWEDDGGNSGHQNKNLLIESKKEKVKNGTARAEFMLTKALMRKAMEGETNPQQLQFYVTVEYYSHKKHATNSVNVNTPDELRTPTSQPQPQPQPQQPQSQPQPAPAPVQPEPEPQSAHGSANNTQPPTPAAPGGVSPSTVDPVKIEELLDAYFAKKEYTKETGEEDGTHTYTFGGSKSGNKTGTAEEKNKVAQIILGKIKESLKSQKKYTTLEVIASALTADAYGKDTTNQKTVTFKTFKLGVDFKKVDSAPLDSKLYLVARTMLLDGKQVTISIKEKDGIIKGTADAVLPVLEITEEQMEQKTPAGQAVSGTEKTVFTGTVKDNMVKIPIHLRPKSEEELKQWQDKISKGKEDGTYTYTFGGATNITNDAQKASTAKIILANAQKGNAKNPKIENGKTSSEEEIKKVLVIKNYQAGDTITFKLLKKVPEFLYLHAKAQGTKQHDKKFLNKEGTYFQIGNKCPRCSDKITLQQIEDLFGILTSHKAFRQEIVDYLNKYIFESGKDIHINTCLRKAHFFAQVGAETLGINPDWMVETDAFRYSQSRCLAIFGDRAKNLNARGLLATYCNDNPQKRLLNYMYADENGFGNGNGNEASGDGYIYRGRGLKQLTGRGNYRNASKYIKDIFPSEYIDLEADPGKVKEAKYAVLSAIAFWEKHEIWKTADTLTVSNNENIKKIRALVNPGLAGWTDAKKYFEKGLTVFRVNECQPVESGDSTWHDPIDNPQRTYYNSNGAHKEQNGAFGPVRTYPDGRQKNHQGLDIFADINTPCKACLKGTIVSYQNEGAAGYGNVLVLEVNGDDLRNAKRNYSHEFSLEREKGDGFDINADKFYLRYAHLKSAVKTSGEVDAGVVICYSGDTGNASGVPNPHLHFEIAMKPTGNGTGLTNRYNPAYFVRLKPINKSEQDAVKNKRS